MRFSFEQLESRRLLVAEGTVYRVDQVVDTTALLGNVTAQASWGDGDTSSLTVTGQPTASSLRFRVDYRYDTRNFFDTALKRQLLQLAADNLTSKFADTLSAIQPSGSNTWQAIFDAPNSGVSTTLSNLTIAANEILIFAGSRDLPGIQLGEGGAGGLTVNGTSQSWLDTVIGRGQKGALGTSPTDFAPWGGSIVFDDAASWYYGLEPEGLQATQSDFYSVAIHELTHVLGFGVSKSWQRWVNGNQFNGPASVAAYDGTGNVPLHSDRQHWRDGISDGGSETMMDPTIDRGVRKLPTRLDLAALDDAGWQLIATSVRVTGEHVFGDNKVFDVALTLRGSTFGSNTIQTQATVTNVAPTLAPRNAIEVATNTPFNLTNLGTFSDPGFNLPKASPPSSELFTYRIDWGDVSPDDTGTATVDQVGAAGRLTLGSFDGSHTYTEAGVYTVRYTITDDDGGSDTQSFVVTVTGQPRLILTIEQSTIAENAGPVATNLRVRREDFDTSKPLVVTLFSSDTSELRLPSSVTILAGGSEALVAVQAIDDTLLDGLIDVLVNARAGNVVSEGLTVRVSDYEPLSLSVVSKTLSENLGSRVSSATVSLPFVAPSGGLRVTISESPTNQLLHPTTVTIPEGSRSLEWTVEARDDFLVEGNHVANLMVSAQGLIPANVDIAISDNDEPLWTNPGRRQDVNNDNIVSPLDALLLINRLNLSGVLEFNPTDELTPPYFDPSGDGVLSPLDALLVINYLNIFGTG